MGEKIEACRACGAGTLTEVLDLGEQRLSDFREDASLPPAFPLRLVLCETCALLQLDETVPRELLYTDRYGFRSGTNETIREDLRSIVEYGLKLYASGVDPLMRVGPDDLYAGEAAALPATWLDIASNDGTLLGYVPPAVYRVGVDPIAAFASPEHAYADKVVVDFFPSDAADRALQAGQIFDVITTISMFYDLDDPGEFIEAVKKRLSPDGVWIIQQNYLVDMLDTNSIDNICHEHVAYYSLMSLRALLKRHGLDVVDVAHSSVNGGCFRVAVRWSGIGYEIDASVTTVLMVESEEQRLDEVSTYRDFGARARVQLDRLAGYVRELVDHGKSVWVYGASTRGGTIWQAAGLTARELHATVERQPEKVGRYYSCIGVPDAISPIVSEEYMRAHRPDYLLVGPWWLANQFVERERAVIEAGTWMIFPLPSVWVFCKDVPSGVDVGSGIGAP
jgi:SAM-dependent methyltransferase